MNFNKLLIKKGFYLFFILIVILFLGYYRDFVFKSINAQFKAWDFEKEYSMPTSLAFLDQLDYTELQVVKWLTTLVFSVVYCLITLITIKVIFVKEYSLIIFVAYGVIIIISAFLMFAGYVLDGLEDKMYEFARYLMGLAQSPVILMILIPAFKISEKEKIVHKN